MCTDHIFSFSSFNIAFLLLFLLVTLKLFFCLFLSVFHTFAPILFSTLRQRWLAWTFIEEKNMFFSPTISSPPSLSLHGTSASESWKKFKFDYKKYWERRNFIIKLTRLILINMLASCCSLHSYNTNCMTTIVYGTCTLIMPPIDCLQT